MESLDRWCFRLGPIFSLNNVGNALSPILWRQVYNDLGSPDKMEDGSSNCQGTGVGYKSHLCMYSNTRSTSQLITMFPQSQMLFDLLAAANSLRFWEKGSAWI